jgi:hypothetical protein
VGYVYKAKAVKVRGAGERMQPRTSAAKKQQVVSLVWEVEVTAAANDSGGEMEVKKQGLVPP